MNFAHSAIAVLEHSGITRGLFAVDVAVKKAPVRILIAEPVSHGKFVLLFEGEVSEVEEASRAAVEASGEVLVEQILLPHAHRALGPAIGGQTEAPRPGDSLAMLESSSIAAAVEAADRVLKTAPLALNRFRLGKGIGGKSYFVFSGSLADAQAGLEAGRELLESRGSLVGQELIPRPNAELLEVL
jgi:microcompartment protein CcmL/EutN